VIRVIRAELLKLRTTPGPWVVVGVTVLLTALGIITAFLVSFGNHVHFVAPVAEHRLRRLVGSGYTGEGVWMAAIIGVLCITGEYRHKVITTSLLLTPRRPELLVAKAVASVVWGIALGVVSLLFVGALGIPLLVSQGGSVSALFGQAGAVIPGLLGAFALLALFGLGFGTLIKNQVAGVLAILGIAFLIEPIITGLLPQVGRWLPSDAASAVAGGIARGNQTSYLLSWWLGVLVLAAWGIVPTVLGYFTTCRRDVT